MKISYSIVDTITPKLQAMLAKFGEDALYEAVGQAASNNIKAHLRQMNREHPNKMGGKRTNFYNQAAKSTSYHFYPGGVIVQIASVGIRQRVLGGPIGAGRNASYLSGKPTKYLTIPAIPEAYGRRASEFHNLKFVQFGTGPSAPKALVEKLPGVATYSSDDKKVKGIKKFQKKYGKDKPRVFFWLRKSVDQKGDASLVPTEEEIIASVEQKLHKLGIL